MASSDLGGRLTVVGHVVLMVTLCVLMQMARPTLASVLKDSGGKGVAVGDTNTLAGAGAVIVNMAGDSQPGSDSNSVNSTGIVPIKADKAATAERIPNSCSGFKVCG